MLNRMWLSSAPGPAGLAAAAAAAREGARTSCARAGLVPEMDAGRRMLAASAWHPAVMHAALARRRVRGFLEVLPRRTCLAVADRRAAARPSDIGHRSRP